MMRRRVRDSWETVRLLLSLGREFGPGLVAGSLAVTAAGFLGPLLLALGLRPLVDGAVRHRPGQVASGAALTGVALLMSALAPTGYRWSVVRMRERSSMVVQRRLLRLGTAAPTLDAHESPEFRDRLQVLRRSVEDLAGGLTMALLAPLITAQLLFSAWLLGGLRAELALLPAVAVPAVLLSRRAAAVRTRAELRAAPHRRTAHHLFDQAATAASGQEIRIYRLRAELAARHREASRAAARETESALLRSTAATAAGWLLFAAAQTAAGALLLREAAAGRAGAGDVAMALGLAGSLVAAAVRLTELAGNALRVSAAAGHYRWLAEAAEPDPAAVGPAPERLADGIVLERVSFGYPGSGAGARPALREVSLRLPAGAVVAVVGENGAGKSTLVKLLCGLHRPSSGRVLVDGRDLAGIDPTAFRERVSAGFQDFARLEFTAGETVGLGDLPRIDRPDAVRGALAEAGADTVVDGLPRGAATPLGASWDSGAELSGGQWQRLSLARTLMGLRPLLVVLDEPAAALDPRAEHDLLDRMAARAGAGRPDGRITLLVTHRLSAARTADLIVVLHGGTVEDAGTHPELLSRGGRYAELYHLQAAAYRDGTGKASRAVEPGLPRRTRPCT